VYEQEASLFFQDLSSTIITDDVIQRLVSFPNVIVTGHQAFFTVEAIGQIMRTTIESITESNSGVIALRYFYAPSIIRPHANDRLPGEVAEWSNVPDSKSGVRVTVPWVRIPPSPPEQRKRLPLRSGSFFFARDTRDHQV
jgi:hypothetical protein